MPWKEVKTMDLKGEFVRLARNGQIGFSTLCKRFGISRKTGYKWLRRFEAQGDVGLQEQSRRPHQHPHHTPPSVERIVLAYRHRYADWGGRKIARLMRNDGHALIPSPSTITAILRRHGLLHHAGGPPKANYIRFEHPHPNDLWQMDFKGDFKLMRGRCHPLTVLDDHSRCSLTLAACENEQQGTVQTHLTRAFQRYGVPLRMTMDNGPPWGSASERMTQMGVWLIEQGIRISHSRPYHPQTQGKDERFHRTMEVELIGRQTFADITHCQRAFDVWRHRYNTRRPHEALGMDTPMEHYQPSPRPYRPDPPPYAYDVMDQVRKVGKDLMCSFQYRTIFVGQALLGKHVAFRPKQKDGEYTVHYCHHQLGAINLNEMPKRTVKGYHQIK